MYEKKKKSLKKITATAPNGAIGRKTTITKKLAPTTANNFNGSGASKMRKTATPRKQSTQTAPKFGLSKTRTQQTTPLTKLPYKGGTPSVKKLPHSGGTSTPTLLKKKKKKKIGE